MKKRYAYGICLYKIEKDDIKILLCKSVSSLNKWGCLKGVMLKDESAQKCAQREFKEECGISTDIELFEEYFEQTNDEKDIGIWLYNAQNVDNLDEFITDDRLLYNYLSWENSKVKFFSIKELPKIKKKQKHLLKSIKDSLESKLQPL